MKKILNLAFMAVAALTIFSCSKENYIEDTKPAKTNTITFILSNNDVDTKASLTKNPFVFNWDEADKVGVFVEWMNEECEVISNENVECSVVKSDAQAQISVPIPDGIKRTLYAYFPRTENANITIPSEQNGLTLENAMPMMSSYVEIEDEESAGSKNQTINFNNLAGILEFNVYTTSEDAKLKSEKVESIEFVAANVGGEYTYTPSEPNSLILIAEGGKSINKITSTLDFPATVGTSKAAASNLVYMVVAPGDYEGAKIVVTTDKAVYIATFPQTVSADANIITPININLANTAFTRDEIVGDKIVVAFYESFDNYISIQGANDGKWSQGSGTIKDEENDNPGWIFSAGNSANKCVKLGSGNAAGSATTPALNINGTATLSFKIGGWDNKSESTGITLSGEGLVFTPSESISYNKAEWTDVTVTVSGLVAGESKITFANSAKNNRFFLDEVTITCYQSQISNGENTGNESGNGQGSGEGGQTPGTGEEGNTTKTVTFDFTSAAQWTDWGITAPTSGGFSLTSTEKTSLYLSPITFTWIDGSKDTPTRLWYNTSKYTEIRVYKNGSITFTADENVIIISASYNDNSATDVNATSYTIVGPNTGNTAIKNVTLTYIVSVDD